MIRRINQKGQKEDGRSFLHKQGGHEGQQNREGIHKCVIRGERLWRERGLIGYASNIANSDSVGEKSNFSAWHSKKLSVTVFPMWRYPCFQSLNF